MTDGGRGSEKGNREGINKVRGKRMEKLATIYKYGFKTNIYLHGHLTILDTLKKNKKTNDKKQRILIYKQEVCLRTVFKCVCNCHLPSLLFSIIFPSSGWAPSRWRPSQIRLTPSGSYWSTACRGETLWSSTTTDWKRRT